jgi:hypothetical protein
MTVADWTLVKLGVMIVITFLIIAALGWGGKP